MRVNADRHIAALDGVRGLAIILVIVFHARLVFLTSAEIPVIVYRLLGLTWSGVDLFLVLSGFLITGILLDSFGSVRYFRTFYARRTLRIFPLYFAYLFLILVIVRFVYAHFLHVDEWPLSKTWWYLGYLQNWKPGHGAGETFLEHLWSLAIEEQFYLLWPVVLWLTPRRYLAWLTVGIAAASFSARMYLGCHGVAGETLYRATATRLDGLALGAFVCLAARNFRERADRWVKPVLVSAVLGILAISAFRSPGWDDPWVRNAIAPLLTLTYSCIVFRTATAAGGLFHRIFSVAWLRSCGKYSYGMYVWHAAPFCVTLPYIQRVTWHGLPFALAVSLKYLYVPVFVLFTYGMARLSWICLEGPFNRLKRHVPYLPAVANDSATGQTTGVNSVAEMSSYTS